MTRHMIAYDLEPGRFSFRAGAIILREGYILAGRSSTETIWYPPGGRVEWGESTRAALEREIIEELGVLGEIGELAIVLESFFTYRDKRFHELAYYYPVSLPADFPFRDDGELCHSSHDGDANLEFKWLRTDPDSLSSAAFYPIALHTELATVTAGTKHLVWTDDEDLR